MSVIHVTTPVHAWNIDGSSSDKVPDMSWIKVWEAATGDLRGLCSFVDCRRQSELGGHLWIKRRGAHLAPICAPCNRWDNAARMQHAEGRHSSLRPGTKLLPVELTDDMRAAERRIAQDSRECEHCGTNIDRRPPSHRQCYACYKSQRQPPPPKRRKRSCQQCGCSLTRAPSTHRFCRACYCGSESDSD